MTVTVNWFDNRQQAVTLYFEAPWTWDEYYATAEEMNALLAGQDHKIDTIVDIRHSGAVPKNSVVHMRQLFTRPNPQTGRLIIVGGNRLIQTLFSTVEKVYRHLGSSPQVFFVTDLAAAAEFLECTPSAAPATVKQSLE